MTTPDATPARDPLDAIVAEEIGYLFGDADQAAFLRGRIPSSAARSWSISATVL